MLKQLTTSLVMLFFTISALVASENRSCTNPKFDPKQTQAVHNILNVMDSSNRISWEDAVKGAKTCIESGADPDADPSSYKTLLYRACEKTIRHLHNTCSNTMLIQIPSPLAL